MIYVVYDELSGSNDTIKPKAYHQVSLLDDMVWPVNIITVPCVRLRLGLNGPCLYGFWSAGPSRLFGHPRVGGRFTCCQLATCGDVP
jgi:hypothetical protein